MSVEAHAPQPIDPEIGQFVDAIERETRRHRDLDSLPLEERRRLLESIRAPWVEGGPTMAMVSEVFLEGRSGPIPARIYQPTETPSGAVLVYMHGGGWTYFSLDTHDRLMREYACRSGITVVGLDYALSPEHRYPVALHQVFDAVRELQNCGERNFGVDPQRIVLGGDSAGANLALATALMLRSDEPAWQVQGMLLNYGAFTFRMSEEAIQRHGGAGSMLSADEMRGYWRDYARDEADLRNPLVCPLQADLHDLPPSLVIAAECDVLAEQSIALASRMQAAGSQARLRVYRGATHSFLEAMSIAAASNLALDESAAWLRRLLA